MKNALIYCLMFAMVQIAASLGVSMVWQLAAGSPGPMVEISIVSSVVMAAGVLFLFLKTRWAVLSNNYLRTRPWAVVFWTILASLGLIIPSIRLEELMPALPNLVEQELSALLDNRWGYLTVGILAPFVEEVVFRGAILRTLLGWDREPSGVGQNGLGEPSKVGLNLSDNNNKASSGNYFSTPIRHHWKMIAISALRFALIHMNPAQMPHAFLFGLLLGWLYYRTGSIIPGIVIHWVNNSVAYVCYNILPDPNAPLVHLLGDDPNNVTYAVLCSACISLPALFQLHQRMKRG